MSEPNKRDGKPVRRPGWGRMQSFIGNDDDTDHPDFDKGSWLAVVLVIALLGAGIVMMLALAGWI